MSAIGTPVALAVLDQPQVRVKLAVALAAAAGVCAVELGGRDLAPLEQPERLLGGQRSVSIMRVTSGP